MSRGRGRPRKPRAELTLYGRERGVAGAPDSGSGAPHRPDDLDADGLILWERITPWLRWAEGIDSVELAAMCDWYSHYLRCRRELRVESLDAKDIYRWQILMGHAWKQFDGIASKFGMTPSDRRRLETATKQQSNPVDEFIDQRERAS